MQILLRPRLKYVFSNFIYYDLLNLRTKTLYLKKYLKMLNEAKN